MIEREELLAFFEEHYRRARGSRRDVRLDDRLYDDLAVDSLLANELLIAMEDRYDLPLLHDPRVWKVSSVRELLDLVCKVEARLRGASAVETAPAAS
jgi:acyl carrier protein